MTAGESENLDGIQELKRSARNNLWPKTASRKLGEARVKYRRRNRGTAETLNRVIRTWSPTHLRVRPASSDCRRTIDLYWVHIWDQRGWSLFIGLQIEYSLIERTVEREPVPMAKALNLGALAWSPLANGVLTGKYHGEGKKEAGRMATKGMEFW